jgi:3-phosphoshikimate 1-carboxyvinyltransferase
VSDRQRVDHADQLRGSVRVPGDKSFSHRALMVSALATGESTITGLSPGEDVAATSSILVSLGATRVDDDERVLLRGPEDGLHPSPTPLECGNSGTTMRLMSGLVSTIAGRHVLVGDASLSRRPMDRVAIPLNLMGAHVSGGGAAVLPPLTVEGDGHLVGISYRVPVASAQVKSAILLAALGARGSTTVVEPVRTRTTTEDVLRMAGVAVTSQDDGPGRRVLVDPSRPSPQHWFVPGDPSQAAFFAVLGAIHPDATLEVLSLDAAPERVGFVGVLARMGAGVRLVERGRVHALTTRSSRLSATEVLAEEVPSLDDVPVLTVAACAATGVSAFRRMGELRVKESDRFAACLDLAQKLGARAWSESDDFFIEGLSSASRFAEFTFAAGLDHRLVMASAVAGCAGGGCTIEGASTVASSYPHFFRDLALLAARS